MTLTKTLKSILAIGFITTASSAHAATIVTDDFESGTESPDWAAFTASITNAPGQGAGGSDYYARVSGNTLAGFDLGGAPNFSVTFDTRIDAAVGSNRAFNLQISTNSGASSSPNFAMINLRYQNGEWGAFNGSSWDLISTDGDLSSSSWTTVILTGSDWGTASASYTLNVAGSDLATGITNFQTSTPTTEEAAAGNFNDVFGSNPGFDLDNVTITAVPEPSSAALLGLGSLCLLARRRR